MGRRRNHAAVTTGRRAALLAGTALCAAALALPAVAQPAPNARPTGGVVSAGSAAISRSPTNTQIDQSTQRAAIDWRSFNVGSQQSVTFNQPSSSATTLNRVTGPDPSQIAGRIDANGQIVLVNQSGVTFYKGAQVNTNGLMVSAAGISNQNFMAGTMKFDQPGNPNAKIVNQGTITVRQAGLAAFVAPQVANAGVINAKLGHVVLAGAKTATLDLYGDGLVSLDVTNQVTVAPSGATALVTNTGVITADGGTVQLTAAAADGVVQRLVDAGGRIRAATVDSHMGTVALNGVGGDIVVVGQLAVPGAAPGTKAGAVEIATTGNVSVASTARIDASGRAGGGTVAIGTTLARARGGPGTPSTTTAKNVTIAAGATIAANAIGNGDGGRVVVLSTDTTRMHGSISARGGTQSGNGGFVEVSGGTLALAGPIDVSAPSGTIGTILLDPDTLEIINAALGGGDQDTNLGATGTILAGDPNTTNNQVSNGEIDSLLGSIVLQATNLLTVDPGTPITLQPNASLTLATLNGNILLGAGSPIAASGTGSIIMHAGTAGSGATLTLNSDLTTGAAGSIALQSDAGIALNAITMNTGVLDVSTLSSGGVTQASGGTITAATLQSSAGIAGGLSLAGTANAIATLGSLAITGGGLLLNNTASLTVAGPVTTSADASISGAPTISVTGSINAGGTLALDAGAGGIAFTASANASGTVLDIVTTGTVSEATGAVINAGTLQSTGGIVGDVSLLSGSNTIAALGGLAVTGASSGFALLDGSALTIGGTVTVAGSAAQLSLQNTAPGGITVPSGGALQADPAGGMVSLRTDAISVAGSIGAAVIELAPNTAGLAVTLGAAGGLSLSSATGLTTSLLRIGSVTAPGGALTTTAGTIVVGGAFGTSGTLELDSLGGIGQTAGALQAATLTGNADGDVLLTNANTIATLGSFTTSGTFALNDTSALSIAGLLNAGVVDLSAHGITEAAGGTINTGVLQSSGGVAGDAAFDNANTIGALAAFTATGSLSLHDATTLSLSGSVGAGTTLALNASGITFAGGAVASGAVVDLTSSAGISQPASAALNAGTLQSSGGISGDVSLAGTANAIANLASFIVSSGSFALTDSIALSVPGVLTANGIALTAPSIDIGGVVSDGGSGTTSLIATTGSIGETGTLIAGTLSGSAAANATFTGINQIGTLGNFTAASFTLHDATPLTVAGSLSAPSIALSAPSIDIGGIVTDGGSGTTSLIATTGSIGETGTLIAGTLSGSAATSAKLIATNQVGTLGDFSAATFAVNDGAPLVVGGSLSAPSIQLTAPTIDIGGVVSDGGSGTTSLIATTGSIGETGTLIAGTLSGSAVTNASLIATNQIGTLGNFIAAAFTLHDATPLTVAGSLSAPSIALTAPTIDIGGAVTDGGSGATSLIATTGSIGETGTFIAGTLSGSAATNAKLTGVNQVGTLGNFTAATFTLHDATPLTVAGTLSAPSIALTAPSIDIGGVVSDGGTGSTSLVATTGSIGETGTLIAGTLSGSAATSAKLTGVNQVGTLGNFTVATFTLHDATPLIIPGTLSAPSIALTAPSIDIGGVVSDGGTGSTSLVATTGSIGETGTLIAGTLSGSAATNVGLTAANQIGTLGNFTAAAFTLNDATPLTVAGALSAPSIALTAPSIDIAGLVSGGGSGTTSLIATTGSIGETGTLIAGTLSGSAATNVSLTATNQIGTLGNFTAASFSLTDTTPLTVPGSLSASSIALTAPTMNIGGVVSDGGSGATSLIATTGSIGETGTLIAGTLSGSAATNASLIATNHVGTLGNFTATSFTLNDSTPLLVTGSVSASSIALTAPTMNIGGVVSDGGSGTTSLIATTGSIGETGALIAGTLSGSAATNASLIATNHVGTLGNFTAATFTLHDATPLTVAGALSAPSIALTAPSIDIAGVVSDGGTGSTSLVATTGSIGETGTLIAGTLSGSAATNAKLTGVNQVGTLGNFTAAAFTLNDTTPLTVAGTLSAPSIALTAPSIDITGVVTDGGSGATSLIATTSTINATGTLIAGTLSGSAADDASFANVNLGTIASFTAADLTLADASALAVTGPVSAATISLTAPSITGAGAISTKLFNADATGAIDLTGANTIAALGSITATSFTLHDTSALALGGSIGVTTADLIVAGTIGETGTFSATTLSGSATGGADFAGSNTIANLGSFSVSGGNFSLTDTTHLTVTGSVSAPGTIALTANGVTVGSSGSVFGATLIDVNGGTAGIALTGTGNIGSAGSGTVDLSTAGSGISEAPTATLNAALLQSTLGIAGDVSLPHTAIGTTGTFIVTGGSIALTDSVALATLRTLTASNGLAITAPSITIGGRVSDGGSSATSLIATTGSIGETGTLIAGTLSGSAATSAKLTGVNQIGTLGNFTAASFSLTNTTPLIAAGTLSAPVIALTAPSITIPGVVSDGGAGTTSLIATTGTIAAPGTLIVGTLSGKSPGAVTLTSAAEHIGTIAAFSAAGFTLDDAAALAITGPLSAASVSLVAPSITGAGIISTPLFNADATGAISLTGANTIAALGSIIATSFTLHDTSALNLGGSVGVTTADLVVAGTIGETGTLSATTLAGSAVGAANFTGSNAIANLGGFAVTGGSFALVDGTGLTVTGGVAADNIAITTPGKLSVGAGMFAPGGTIALTANGVTVGAGGSVFGAALIDVNGGSAGIALTGNGNIGSSGSGTVDLSTTGGITEAPTATLNAALLRSALGVTGDVSLPHAAVAAIGDFSVTSGSFSLTDSVSLDVLGALTAAKGIALTAPAIDIAGLTSDGGTTTSLIATTGSIGETGTLIAGTLSGSAATKVSLTAVNQVGTLGTFTAAAFSLADATSLVVPATLSAPAIALTAPSLSITGRVTDGGTGTTSLVATAGTISATGTLDVGTLSGSSTGNTDLVGAANKIGTIASVSAANLTLTDASALAVTGPVSAATISLTAPAISGAGVISTPLLNADATGAISLTGANTIAALGSITATSFTLHDASALSLAGSIGVTTANLLVAGTINETGTLAATTLAGSAIGAASFTGSNTIANLGSFTVSSGSLILLDTSKLTVTGPVTASGSIYLASSNAGGIAVASGGTLASPLTSVQADAFSNAGVVSATTFELAPFDSGATMFVPPTAGIATTTARFGAVTVPGSGLTTTAGSIVIGASFGTSTMAIELDSQGDITETTGALTAATLTGLAPGNAVLGAANSIATLGSFTAGGTFLLKDASPLSVSATLNAPLVDLSATSIAESKGGTIIAATLQSSSGVAGNALLTNANSIATLGGFITGGTFALNDASALTVNGPLSASVVDLTAASITEPASAVITAGILQSTGGVSGNVSLAGSANAIGTLGAFFVTGGDFALTDATGLTTAGSGLAADNIAITTPGNLNVTAGMFAPGTIALTANGVTVASGGSVFGAAVIDVNGGAGGIALTGTGNIGSSGPGTVDLSATGGITEAPTATLNAGLLQSALGVTGDVSLPHAAIGAIGDFIVTAGSFALTDSAALSVLGALTATKSVAITAPSIDIPGVVSDGGSGTTSLIATTGSISETGSLIAGTLSGSAVTSADLIGTNQIGTLGNFTAASFTLDDTAPLLVSGTLSAPSIALTAASIDIPGKVTDGGSGTTSLIATTGTIAETGTLIAGTLSGSSAGSADFAAASIGTIAGFTATSFDLLDASSLTVNGLSANVVNLTAPSIDIPGPLTGMTSVNLVATSGGITETNVITTFLLTGSVAGSANLSGSNLIDTIGDFTASGFTLSDNISLSVNGSLSGGPSVTVNINNLQTIAVNGSITANAISLAAKSIYIPGFISDGGAGTVNLIAAGDGLSTINETGTLIVGTLTGEGSANLTGTNQIATLGNFNADLTLFDNSSLTVAGSVGGGNFVTIVDAGALTAGGSINAFSVALTGTSITIPGLVGIFDLASVALHAVAGSITETGRLNAATLSGDATASASLTGANLIAALGNFTSAGFTLNDNQNLAVTGVVQGGPSIVLPSVQSVSGSGVLIATTLTGSAAGPVSLTGPNQITTLADFSAPSFALNNATALAVAGALNAGASAQLTAAGPITEPGTIIAGTLSGSAAGPASFTGTNQIAALGPFSATDLTLIDTQSLAVTGNVSASNVALTIAGNLTGTAALATNTFTGTASGNVALTGGNTIATLNSFSAGGSFVLDNASNLTIASTLTAPKIVINVATQLTLGDGATIVTGGSAKPSPNVTFLPNASSAPQGAFLSAASFFQLGSSTVTGISSANIVRIDTSGAGKLAFDPSAGLNAPDTWLIVGVGQGQISGNVNVAALDVTYGSVAGGSSLTGIVGGISGVTAAGAVGIQPAANANYRFNSCVIHSVNCVLLPPATIPTANPLNALDIGALSNPQDQEDLLLPVVSDQDY